MYFTTMACWTSRCARGRWVLSKAALFISISEYISEIATRRRGAGFQPVRTVPNPAPQPLDLAEEELRAVRQSWGLDTGATIIGIFGRLVTWKGQMEFLQAFRQTRELFPNIVALVVGDASDLGKQYEARLRQWVAEQGLAASWCSPVTAATSTRFTRSATSSCMPRSNREPFGLVIVEAMSAGAAVIASPLGAAPEIITHRVTGLIADPRDPDELAQALALLLSDPDLRKRIALTGKKYAREKYAPERFAHTIDSLYQEILPHSK